MMLLPLVREEITQRAYAHTHDLGDWLVFFSFCFSVFLSTGFVMGNH
jgi:hypothetical protein